MSRDMMDVLEAELAGLRARHRYVVEALRAARDDFGRLQNQVEDLAEAISQHCDAAHNAYEAAWDAALAEPTPDPAKGGPMGERRTMLKAGVLEALMAWREARCAWLNSPANASANEMRARRQRMDTAEAELYIRSFTVRAARRTEPKGAPDR